MRPAARPEPRFETAVGPAGRWQLAEAHSESDPESLGLFRDAFDAELPLAQWQWKYRNAPLRGLLLRNASRAVAFFGGMPRTVRHGARALAAVQNGDVMVAPAERSVFTRHGALYQVASRYFERFVGPGRTYALAYGFPNERHFRLGAKLGLYRDGGRMVTLTWSASVSGRPSMRQERVEAGNLRALAPLAGAMTRDWPTHLIPARDAAHWEWRYLSHPVHRYELVLARGRWTRRPLCALVLREHAGHVDWLDYAGPRSRIDDAVAIARGFAHDRGGKPVVALFSESIAGDFAAHAASRELAMPVALASSSDEACTSWPLWLMGGDTDFL
jgi:hypothetical protein